MEAYRIFNPFQIFRFLLLDLVNNIGVNIKAREHSVDLLLSLLKYAFHRTAVEMMDLEVSNILATAFGQDSQYLSPDLILTLVDIIESLSANVEYREQLCENNLMTKNLGMLLMVREPYPPRC